MDSQQRMRKAYSAEMDKQGRLIIGGAALALWRYHGWRTDRIDKFLTELYDACHEIEVNSSKTVFAVLEEETGIELKLTEDGKSWHDLPYLNGEFAGKELPHNLWLYVQNQRIKWIGAWFLAAVMLTLHRLYGWGAERSTRLMEEIYAIRDECGGKPAAVGKKLGEETGIDLVHLKQSNAADLEKQVEKEKAS